MASCPNCGGTVAGTDPVCDHCGASLDDQEAPPGSDQPGGQPRSAQRGGQPGGRPRQRGPPADEGRRDVLKYGLGAVALAGVGWLVLDEDSEQEGTDPALDEGPPRNPQVGISLDNTSEGVEVKIQSVYQADSVAVDCGDGTFHDWEADAGKSLEAGSSLTCGGSEPPTYEPEPGDTITVRATYDGNTEVLYSYEVE